MGQVLRQSSTFRGSEASSTTTTTPAIRNKKAAHPLFTEKTAVVDATLLEETFSHHPFHVQKKIVTQFLKQYPLDDGGDASILDAPAQSYTAGSSIFDRVDIPNLAACTFGILPIEVYNLGDYFGLYIHGRMLLPRFKQVSAVWRMLVAHIDWQKERNDKGVPFTMGIT